MSYTLPSSALARPCAAHADPLNVVLFRRSMNPKTRVLYLFCTPGSLPSDSSPTSAPSHYNGVAPSSGTQTHAHSTALEVTAKKGGPGHFETTAAAHLILVKKKENTKYVQHTRDISYIHLVGPRYCCILDKQPWIRINVIACRPCFFCGDLLLSTLLRLQSPPLLPPKNHDPSLKQDGLSSVGSMLLLWEAGTLVPSTDWEVLGRTT